MVVMVARKATAPLLRLAGIELHPKMASPPLFQSTENPSIGAPNASAGRRLMELISTRARMQKTDAAKPATPAAHFAAQAWTAPLMAGWGSDSDSE